MKTAGPRGSILNLRKISLLQEMQDATIAKLNNLLNRMEDSRESEEELEEEFMSPSKSFLISMSDKLVLLNDYQKISLHLLESNLSNQIESSKVSFKEKKQRNWRTTKVTKHTLSTEITNQSKIIFQIYCKLLKIKLCTISQFNF